MDSFCISRVVRIICLLSVFSLHATSAGGGVVIDQWVAMKSTRSVQARDEQVRAFRRDFAAEIHAKKNGNSNTL